LKQKLFHIESTKNLPEHDRILKKLLGYFCPLPIVEGAFLSGSVATDSMDQDSDLDIGILFKDKESREKKWKDRWNWNIASWFHRFDADHIKSHFVIYLFEPNIKADINLYVECELPPREGGPYRIVYDKSGMLRDWQTSMSSEEKTLTIWSNVLHEDERYWAWLFYLYSHVNRGEYYNGATEFPAIRNIYEQWIARLAGEMAFNSRKVERTSFYHDLTHINLFPKPDRYSLKRAMMNLTRSILKLRVMIEKRQNLQWNTSMKAIEKITSMVESL
jgi:hypothetical protein